MIGELDYAIMMERAMRNVTKLALKKAQRIKNKNFCFLFIINTKYEGVILPDYLRKQYPNEITLILQHQFANLNVQNSYFSVDLSFNGKMERVVIPFGALVVFSDQKAGIELRFELFEDLEELLDDNYNYDDIIHYNYDFETSEANSNVNPNDNLISFRDIERKGGR